MNEVTIKTKRQSKIYKNTIYMRNFVVVDPINNSSQLSLSLSKQVRYLTPISASTLLLFSYPLLILSAIIYCMMLYHILFFICIHSPFFRNMPICMHLSQEQRTKNNIKSRQNNNNNKTQNTN